MKLGILHTPLKLPPLAARALDERSEWYAPRPVGDEWIQRAHAARTTVNAGWLDALLSALEPRGPALERIHRAAAEGIVVTAGQQPGLFGGPMYTWLKALTALALADSLEERLRLPVAPVFWAATDDSDLAEATATVVSVPGGAETIVLERTAERDTPMASIPIGDASAAMARLFAACGSSPHADILDRVSAAYTADSTLGGAYVQLLRDVLHPLGVSVLDAAHPATRAAASPLLNLALRKVDSISEKLQQRSRQIAALGLKPQVRDVPGRTLVFAVNGTRRTRVRASEAAAVAERAGAQDLSPNVLLRPIVERAILPTVAYVGGPAEIAYFAQVGAVADALGVDAPLIVPRWSGFLVEPHVQQALERLAVGIEDLRDPHLVEGRIAREDLPAEVRAVLEQARLRVTELEPRLLDSVHSADLPLADAAIRGASRQLEHKLDRLERRLLAAMKRHGSERLQLLATARGSLFPGDMPQERALNMIPLLARYGNAPLEGVLAAARSYVAKL